MSQSHKLSSKTVVIGLDSVTFDLITPWIEAGKLPNIKKLMDKGCSGVLKSTVPPLSPVAWTTFLTGMNPAKHGILDFVEPVSNSKERIIFNNRTRCRQKPIWKYLNNAGYRTVMINIPMTYPPEKVDGCMVSGMGTPSSSSEYTYPPDLKNKLIKELGKYIIDLGGFDTNMKTDDIIKFLHKMVKNRLAATRYLLETTDWDFFMVVFMAIDRAQHKLWKYMDPEFPGVTKQEAKKYGEAILQIHQDIDAAVGTIVSCLDDNTNIVIMSDHGADAVYQSISLNQWLADKGFLAYKKVNSGIFDRIISSALYYKVCKRFFPGKAKRTAHFFKSIDSSKTKAFFLGAWGKVFINLKDRFPDGIVEPGREYEEVRNEIIRELMTLKDPKTGKPVIRKIFKREDIYSGDLFSQAPDLVIEWERGYNCLIPKKDLMQGVRANRRGEVFIPPPKISGDHTLKGIFIINSPMVNKNKTNMRAHISDLCPTILYMMDIPIPESMDGKVFVEGFKETCIKDRPLKYYKDDGGSSENDMDYAYSDEESKLVEDRLKDLGYLD